MGATACERHPVRGPIALVAGGILLALVAFGAIPRVTAWTHASIRPAIDERGIEADALFWTESPRAVAAYRYLRDSRAPGPRVRRGGERRRDARPRGR